jgi:hypothetical protein
MDNTDGLLQIEIDEYGITVDEIYGKYINSTLAELAGPKLVISGILDECLASTKDEAVRQKLKIAKFILHDLVVNEIGEGV